MLLFLLLWRTRSGRGSLFGVRRPPNRRSKGHGTVTVLARLRGFKEADDLAGYDPQRTETGDYLHAVRNFGDRFWDLWRNGLLTRFGQRHRNRPERRLQRHG